MILADLLSVPFGRYSEADFDKAMNDPEDVVWKGGISVKAIDGAWIGKTGTFWIPARLDPHRAPARGSKAWRSGKGVGRSIVLHQTSIFAELDDCSISEQLERLQLAVDDGLPMPTAIVMSGDARDPDVAHEPGKSLHLFWRMICKGFKPDDPDREMCQRALLQKLGSDPSIMDPARRMRWGGVRSYDYGPWHSASEPRIQTILYLGDRVPKETLVAWARKIDPKKGKGRAAPYTLRKNTTTDFTQLLIRPDRTPLSVLVETLPNDGSTESVCCPFHDDNTPSAFLARNRAGTPFLHCSKCANTWWDKPEVPLKVCKQGTPHRTMSNVARVLEHDTAWKGRLRLDERRSTPTLDGRTLQDNDTTELRKYLDETYEFEPTKDNTWAAMIMVACRNPQNELRDYLKALVWDGTPRLDLLLIKAFSIKDTELHRAYGRCFALSAVARAMEPGCKVDNVLLTVGGQGIGKSTWFRTLAGPEWFQDTQIDLSSKDAYMQLSKAWIYEIAELSSFSKTDTDNVKRFLTSQTDTFRKPYERTVAEYPRHSVVAASTNNETPLTDPTGNRRFFCITVPDKALIDLTWTEANRDQIWAEAMHAYSEGEPWWLERGSEMAELQEKQNKNYMPEDTREDMLRIWIHGNGARKTFTLGEALGALGIKVQDHTRHQQRVAKILRSIGCRQLKRGGQARTRSWLVPGGTLPDGMEYVD